MSLLTLKDIGKIYVSEGNATVGIRGVNLSFDKGEFVAITGKSGSGKSTLLNVISGMDSYEEGELYIEGQPTSHYLQPEWEEYRKKYISFIFQDYNIIDSFTVLQNVELALMNIDDKKARRARALELIDRVGLTPFVKQKGSKLSGGQKQRTVIARALAKDSPIILADEPTGNLDSATSKEIIELLREVSKDKLLIVVTHNFDQVEDYATRHIRIFDGAVESDHVMKHTETSSDGVKEQSPKTDKKGKKKEKIRDIRNGITLGRTIFTSKPKLSVFLCFLMVIGTLGIFMVTTFCGEATDMFDKHYMFSHIDGRVVVVKQNGEAITDEELSALAEKSGAKSTVHYDLLLDESYGSVLYYDENKREYDYVDVQCTYNESFGDGIVGSYPTEANEVFLYLPIAYQNIFGKDSIITDKISFQSLQLKVTGVKYYYDNNIRGKMVFTEEGFKVATAVDYLSNNDTTLSVAVTSKESGNTTHFDYYGNDFITSFNVENGKIYIFDEGYREYVRTQKEELSIQISFTTQKYKDDYYGGYKTINFVKTFTGDILTDTYPDVSSETNGIYIKNVAVHPSVIVDIANDVMKQCYSQASLFFENDKAAHNAISALRDEGYVAVTSDTTYSPDPLDAILTIIQSLFMGILWILAILFLAFFINLCSSRVLGAFKSDMAIMRSMGIPVRVIKIGMYVRMLISLVPAFITVIGVAILIFTTPTFNKFFVYLYPWQYAVIFVGMIILTARITHKQIRKLFGESVKKSLKGGAAE
ncbi:MAG: ATP-binding cassette domain-containing protein [Eubacteriales bacterium]